MEDISPESLEDNEVFFITMGEIILDELHFSNGDKMVEVLGGAGTYAALGARLHLPPPVSQSLYLMIEAGYDLPSSVEDSLRSWDTRLDVRKDPTKKTTRAKVVYEDATFGPKTFEYLASTMTLLPSRLRPLALSSASFHLICPPETLKEQIPGILALRQRHGMYQRPLFIWEPEGSFCSRDSLEAHLEAARLVDIFSPNRFEVSALFGSSGNPLDESSLETMCALFVDRGIGPLSKGTIVVRSDEHGCFAMSSALPFTSFPAHSSVVLPTRGGNAGHGGSKVVDPTGAGHAFLGGFTIGLIKTGSVIDAVGYGSVSATFALEQIGLPKFKRGSATEEETWNRDTVARRLRQYGSLGRSAESEQN
ncbi:related to pfkB family carbohydrate kinase superfamily [Phialocephala subalpina]|uniref:Related to pfkB family carbohydrate kinase superfamily n=1 Tax=Phialocephala subalpina TaxID=576137 RepID=A0A1L7XYH0_9HELO|nr:related to pfkB family carbohydrate kinase superfamily [Phialocephala subalpina]